MMQIRQDNHLRYKVEFSGLPLAVYREIAVHLRQVEAVETELICQSSQQFSYNQSQVEGLLIEYSQLASLESRKQVEQILAYYQDRYGGFKIVMRTDD